jgi:hypothetical protein
MPVNLNPIRFTGEFKVAFPASSERAFKQALKKAQEELGPDVSVKLDTGGGYYCGTFRRNVAVYDIRDYQQPISEAEDRFVRMMQADVPDIDLSGPAAFRLSPEQDGNYVGRSHADAKLTDTQTGSNLYTSLHHPRAGSDGPTSPETP